MKKITLIAALFSLLIINTEVSAQTEKAKEIRKEVNVEVENGIKTLTIKTVIDGEVTTEVYKGAEADAKIAEFENKKSGTTKTMVIGEDGKQHLKVEKRVVIKEEKESK